MDSNWKRKLRREASAHGMCAEYREELGSVETKHDAIVLYKRCIDWALEEGLPTIETLRHDFNDCEVEGVFVDKEFHGEVLNDSKVYIFHNCKGRVMVGLNREKRIIPMLYFANGCDMEITGMNNCLVPVYVPLYVFGDNRIMAEQSEGLICKTYKFDVK